MTILHILDHSVPIFSGYSFRSRSIMQFQQRLGLRPVVLTSPKQESPGDGIEVIEGLPYYRTGQTHGRLQFMRELRQIVAMAKRIETIARKEKACLLHAHSPLLNGLPALWAGRRLRLPVIYESRAFWEDAAVDHGTTREGSVRYRLTRALETVVFRRADRVVTICQGMRQDILGRGVAPERVAVIPNGVDAGWFSPRARNEALARAMGVNGGPVFGFVGSFYRYEGLRFVLEAAPALRRALPNSHLLLVGSGDEEPDLRTLARPLQDAVVFAGRVPHQEVREFYSIIDVFLCPRRRMRLTELVTPLKPLEAMAMAKPVLASDVGGLRELVRNGESGILFPPESHAAFVQGAAQLGESAAMRARLGAAGRAAVLREREWAELVSRYRSVYDGLL